MWYILMVNLGFHEVTLENLYITCRSKKSLIILSPLVRGEAHLLSTLVLTEVNQVSIVQFHYDKLN